MTLSAKWQKQLTFYVIDPGFKETSVDLLFYEICKLKATLLHSIQIFCKVFGLNATKVSNIKMYLPRLLEKYEIAKKYTKNENPIAMQ